MNKIALFMFGCLTGVSGTLYVVSDAPKDQPIAASATSHATEISASSQLDMPAPQPLKNDGVRATPSLKEPGSLDIEFMLTRFTANAENLFENNEYKDLAYLIRKDKKVAAAVRNKLLHSTSYEEKYALINLLAQDSSPETVDLVIDMIKKPDDESKRLGFELLRSMDIKENQPELNNVLLDSTYYETNPELLTDVIFRLSEKKLDETTKTVAIDRFQSLLSNNNNLIKARAIDGLSQLGNQETISATVKRYLQDTDENVRVSAISAAFKLNTSHLDEEILGALTRITKNPGEPESVRNMASAVLESQKAAL